MATTAFFAVLRDVAKLASSAADDVAAQATKFAAATADDIAAQSVKLVAATDDVAALAGKASANTASLAGDDLAVGAGQMTGLAPNREIPAILKIAKGSLVNKVWLSAVLLIIAEFAPMLIIGCLFLGLCYLAYEGAEALLACMGGHTDADESQHTLSEDQKVSGAIKTDIVLSFEILLISLNYMAGQPVGIQALALALVSVIMTLGVYGTIGLILRLDDMGFALLKSNKESHRNLGRRLVNAAPIILRWLEPIGMVAMFGVAGGLLMHHGFHYAISNWVLGLTAEIVLGAVLGLLLVTAHKLLTKFTK